MISRRHAEDPFCTGAVTNHENPRELQKRIGSNMVRRGERWGAVR
jgi:hypothetical protein